ncbi:MAG: hypothetical protein [Caudoviricetes sp.]|nr:MAG: hypothetical protein [Caudoviricetes sp.]
MKHMQDKLNAINDAISNATMPIKNIHIPDVSEIGNTATYMVVFLLPDTR